MSLFVTFVVDSFFVSVVLHTHTLFAITHFQSHTLGAELLVSQQLLFPEK